MFYEYTVVCINNTNISNISNILTKNREISEKDFNFNNIMKWIFTLGLWVMHTRIEIINIR